MDELETEVQKKHLQSEHQHSIQRVNLIYAYNYFFHLPETSAIIEKRFVEEMRWMTEAPKTKSID